MKKHLRIKYFIGNSENAVKAQILCVIATYILVIFVKNELQLDTLHYTLLQSLSMFVFEKI